MQLIALSAIAIGLVAHPVMGGTVAITTGTVAFNVAPLGTPCGEGTTIFCTLSSGQSCAGNFNPIQASIVVTEALGNCHIDLFPQNNQQGGVVQVLNTDTTGTCIFTSVAEYQSYELTCD